MKEIRINIIIDIFIMLKSNSFKVELIKSYSLCKTNTGLELIIDPNFQTNKIGVKCWAVVEFEVIPFYRKL